MKGFESWMLSYLVNSLWQIPLLFAAGWTAARALRSVGAAAEHRVWVTVLLAQSLLPACSTLPWEWLRSAFFRVRSPLRTGDAHVTVVMGPGTPLNIFHLPPLLLTVIAITYCAVSAYFAARFLWRCHKLRSIRLHAAELVLTDDAALYWKQCSQRFGSEAASIATSSQIFSPVTMGLSRKLVLLPEAMVSELPSADMCTVIAHELAHVRRNDFFKNLIYELISLPVSFHPVSSLTRKHVMESREMVCDAMAAGIDGRQQYARSLLRLASLLVNGTLAETPHAIGIFDANTFERRLMRLTEKQSKLGTTRRVATAVACIALSLGTCVTAWALRMQVDAATASGSSNAAQSSAPLSVPASEMEKHKLTGAPPTYPIEAKKAGIQGVVQLSAVIGKDGTVENLKVVSGPKELQQASLDAVRQWTYRPYQLNGNPVEVETTINVTYALAK
jgi:TonB family protein